MADSNVRVVISAQDNASAVVRGFSDSVGKSSENVQSFGQKMSASFAQFAVVAVAAGAATDRLVGVINGSVDAANKSQAAMTGLASVARAFGSNADEAKTAAQSLANDGLLTVSEAASGLKNLLAAGFNLKQATVLMNRFRDSAAFGRQGSLEFGQAIVSATEGIKNGNSILVDNAGVTKNLSVILTEAGYSAQDMGRATTDAGVRQAIFNGILKETNPQLGDAAKLSESFAGSQAKLHTQTTILQQQLGTALQPALSKLLETITPLVQQFAVFAQNHPQLTANILLGTVAFLGIVAAIGALGAVLPPVIAGISILSSVFTVATGAAAGLTLAVAAPFALVVVGVAAIAAAVYWVNQLHDAWDRANAAARTGDELENTYIQKVRANPNLSTAEKNRLIKNVTGGARAMGGPVMGGTSYLVGERGPEIFTPSNSGKIIPNHQLAQGSSGGTVNITVQAGAFMGNPSDARKYAQLIADALKDVAGAKNMSASEYLS